MTRKKSEQFLQYYYLSILDDRELDFDLFYDIRNKLDSTISSSPENTAIDIWLTSPGGDAHAAYKIYLELRSRCSQLRMVIPNNATSAATLLSLGMDTIFMAASAELGPLDAQIPNPQPSGSRYISALDIANAPNLIGQNAINFAMSAATEMLINAPHLSQEYAMQHAMDLALHIYQPMMKQIDAPLFHRATNYMTVMKEYAQKILLSNTAFLQKLANIPEIRKVKLEKQAELMLKEIMRIAEDITTDYPDHRYLISRDEALYQQFLPIQYIDAYPLQVYVKYQAKRAERLTRQKRAEGKEIHTKLEPYFFCYNEAKMTKEIAKRMSSKQISIE